MHCPTGSLTQCLTCEYSGVAAFSIERDGHWFSVIVQVNSQKIPSGVSLMLTNEGLNLTGVLLHKTVTALTTSEQKHEK